jgi:hypothetical protein
MKKKFFTMLLSIAVYGLIIGQVPVVVKGQMKNVGDVKSLGSVLLRASNNPTPDQVGEIINYGTLVLEEGLTLASNDETDGLLYNHFSGNATVTFPNSSTKFANVRVEKEMKVSTSQSGDLWYFISLPFDVNISEIEIVGRGTTWNLSWYDVVICKNSHNRVNTGFNTDQWELCNSDKSGVLNAGEGYAIALDDAQFGSATSATMIFPAKDGTTVNKIYASGDKIVMYPYFHDKDGTSTNYTTELSWGWAALGTYQTHNYLMHEGNIQVNTVFNLDGDYLDHIYIYKGSSLGWDVEALSQSNVNIAPYTAYLVHLGIDNSTTRSLYNSGATFPQTNYVTGLNVNDAVYRSQSNTSSNAFRLTFQADNSELSDKLWIFEGDRYKNDLHIGEDALKLFSPTNALSQFYTLIDNALVAINRFQAITEDIPLGLKLINDANYTIDIVDLIGFEDRNIYLLDKSKGVTHNLTESAYTFRAGAGTDNDRFVIRVTNNITGIYPIGSDIKVWAQNYTIFVQGVQNGDKVTIYDVTGQLLKQSTADSKEVSYPVGKTGIFVVKVNGSNNVVTKVISK